MLSSEILPVKLRIVRSDPLSGVSYICVVYAYNDCPQMNQSHHLRIGLTSHLSNAYDTFYSSCFSFPLVLSMMTMDLTNQMMTDQGLGSLWVRAFCYVLNYFLIESFACRLVKSFEIESQYF